MAKAASGLPYRRRSTERGGDGLLFPGGAARVRIVQVDGTFVAIAVSPRPDDQPPASLDTVADELRPLIDSITFD